jgi:hypothetical protein
MAIAFKPFANQITETTHSFNARVETIQTKLNTAIAGQAAELRRVSAVLEESILGGIRGQLFGFLLLVYGAIVGLLTNP